MKNISSKILVSAIAAAALFTGCGDTTDGGETSGTTHHSALCTSDTTVQLSGTYSSDLTIGETGAAGVDAAKCYSITGTVKINGAKLTVKPGTIVYGTTPQSYLAVLRGAQIDANGTATNPIIFTSAEEVSGLEGKQGQWGGLTLFGNAVTNKDEQTYEADSTVQFGRAAGHADANNTESSGVLNYIMVRNSGYNVAADAELNGLSLAGVGSGTLVTNVAVVNGKDDGIEIWGGTVNLTNAYMRSASDDSLDLDNGYTGTVDNFLIIQDATGDRGIEADSLSDDDAGTPRSAPTLKNFTIKTADGSDAGAHFRQGITPTLINGVIEYKGTKTGTYAIELANAGTAGTEIASATDVEIVTNSELTYGIDGDNNSSNLPTGVTVSETKSKTGADETKFTWITDYETAKGL